MAEEPGAAAAASSSSSEKSAFVLVENLNGDFEWYAFNVSDDVEVNKPPPAPLHYALLGDAEDFHEDVIVEGRESNAVDDVVEYKCKAMVKFKPPIATADYERERELGNCWAILGLEDKKKTAIYRICIEDVKASEDDEAEVKYMGRFCRADVLTSGGGSPTTKTKWESVRPMPNYLSSFVDARTLVLSDKVYCLGCWTGKGKDGKKERRRQQQSPWAVAYDPKLEEWEYLPDPPRLPQGGCVDAIFSAAAMLGSPSTAPSPCILVGLPHQGLIQFYFVDTGKWVEEEFRCCKFFHPKDLCGKAVAVGNTLYWYVVDRKRLGGYDLRTKTWFVGRLAIHDDWGYVADNYGYKNPPPSLAHLGGDMFCLLWVSPLVPVEFIGISRIHCLKFRVTVAAAAAAAAAISGPEGEIIPVEATILSCQYCFISGSKTYCDGLVV